MTDFMLGFAVGALVTVGAVVIWSWIRLWRRNEAEKSRIKVWDGSKWKDIPLDNGIKIGGFFEE